jgi:hypothetical protein
VQLASLSVVNKRDLMAHFDDWVTDPDITIASLRRDFLSDPSLVGARCLGRYHVATTSGTSGEPAILIHDASSALFHFVGRWGEWRFIARRDLLSGVLRGGLRAAALFVADGHIGASAALESARRRSAFLANHARLSNPLNAPPVGSEPPKRVVDDRNECGR